MKRLSVAFALLLAVSLTGVAFAADEISPDWAGTVQLGGYVDVRPSFYWFSPELKDADDFHASDIVFYEAGVSVLAQPFDAIRGVATLYYGEGPVDYMGDSLGDNASGAIYFDEGYLQLGDDQGLWARFGKYYVPLSTFEGFGMQYDLLQRNVFQNPVALGAGYNYKFVGISAHLWNGQYDMTSSSGRADNDIIDTYAAALNVYPLAMFEKYYMNIGGYFVTDATETWGQFGNYLNTTVKAYNTNVPLYGGYLVAKLFFTDLLGLGLKGEYATTGEFKEENYVDGAGDATAISFTEAELAFLFWEGVLSIGGKYEAVSGIDYFGVNDPTSAYYDADYEAVSYSRYGGFLRTNLMQELSVGLEYLTGSDNEGNSDMELQVQTRVDF